MNVIKHGIDIVDVGHFSSLFDDTAGDFIERCFTRSEQMHARSLTNEAESLAGKFAAKEAVAKALGRGFGGSYGPKDIEIEHHDTGEPFIVLHGAAAAVSKELGIVAWSISISHAGALAVASVIALAA